MTTSISDQLTLSIEKLVYGGDGLAHTDGNTVFVPYVLPGEEVHAKTKNKKKKLIWAELIDVVAPSAVRQKAPCPHFQVCGGCHYQHISATEQVRLKKEILRETLSRLGGISWQGPVQEHTAEPYHYRNRAQWAIRNSNPRAIGYFLPESSVVVPIDECRVLSPTLAKTFCALQELARSGQLPEKLLEIEAFTDSADSKIALNIAFERFTKPAAEIAAQFQTALPELESLLLLDQNKDRFELTGPGFLFHQVGGYRYRVSHLSFFQVNRFLLEDLLQIATAGAKGETALDLYAGVGFFTLPLARNFNKVVAVDANLAATHDLHANAEAAGVSIIAHNQHAEEFLSKTQERPDFVLLDPPRSGLGQKASLELAAVGAQEIVYLSCDPSTLARDLAVLTGSKSNSGETDAPSTSYEIVEMHLFDLFPQTFHIETLVKLRRLP